MQKVKIIEKIEVEEAILVDKHLKPCVLVEEKEVMPGKNYTEEILEEDGKKYLKTLLTEEHKETGEMSYMMTKVLLKDGDYLYEAVNLYSGEKRHKHIPSSANCYTLEEAKKEINKILNQK